MCKLMKFSPSHWENPGLWVKKALYRVLRQKCIKFNIIRCINFFSLTLNKHTHAVGNNISPPLPKVVKSIFLFNTLRGDVIKWRCRQDNVVQKKFTSVNVIKTACLSGTKQISSPWYAVSVSKTCKALIFLLKVCSCGKFASRICENVIDTILLFFKHISSGGGKFSFNSFRRRDIKTIFDCE